MKTIAAILAALALTSIPSVTGAQQVSVTLNGSAVYLNPGPIERNGRVFVPLRGIFERLGAAVVYSAGQINATRGNTTVSLQIGSTQANVNGQPQYLDVAPFIVGASTYVPLRFIAQSLGANVNYIDSTRVVAIQMQGAGGGQPPYPPRPPVPPPPPPVVRLRAQQPPPDSETRNRFALIAAEFVPSADPNSARVWLDGNNITYRSGMSPSGFSYKPPAPLDFGAHTVRVAGRGPGGIGFDRSWSFVVRRSIEMYLTMYQPPPNAPVGRNFTVTGNTVANSRIRVTAGPSPDSMGQFSGTTTAGPKGNFSLDVSLKPLIGQQTVTVRIVATDPVSGQSTDTTLRLRLNV
jgi:hypothetical protein